MINNREKILPENEEAWLEMRLLDVTSTEISALFGCCPYLSKWELWHNKKDRTSNEFKENKRMKWGNRLEPAIAYGVAEDLGVKIKPMNEYIRLTDIRAGSSFDFQIEDDGILEVQKNRRPRSDFKTGPVGWAPGRAPTRRALP